MLSKTQLANDINHWLGDESPLKNKFDGFSKRDAQLQMALKIGEALLEKSSIIVEAPTGIGKTLAYLIPALLAGKRVVVASRTKVLQEQLMHHDLPKLLSFFPEGKRVAMLKGKENYLSEERVALTRDTLLALSDQERKDFHNIELWAKVTKSGDKADCLEVSPTASIWRMVTNRSQDELEPDGFCASGRKRAQHADILIVNQHLLCADLQMRNEGDIRILPTFDVFIVDEAHAFPEIAGMMFSDQISYNQLLDLSQDGLTLLSEGANNNITLNEKLKMLEVYVERAKMLLSSAQGRFEWHTILKETIGLEKWVIDVFELLSFLEKSFQEQSERGHQFKKMLNRFQDIKATFKVLLDEPSTETLDFILWSEVARNGYFRIYITPIKVAAKFREMMKVTDASWIFTSATLAVNNNFSSFQQRIGLDKEQCTTLALPSPFDYKQQGVFYQLSGIVDPNAETHTALFLSEVLPILKLLKGRTFILFTSYAALNRARVWLEDKTTYNLLVQGEQTSQHLVDAFKSGENNVLLATHSFWEGIDVKGKALSCVIIDKLPFPSPDDPLVKARRRWYEQAGKNHFMQDVLPRAILQLRQGVGRLIRGMEDKGVLVIADPRLNSKQYGKLVLNSLPEFRSIHTLEALEAFWHE